MPICYKRNSWIYCGVPITNMQAAILAMFQLYSIRGIWTISNKKSWTMTTRLKSCQGMDVTETQSVQNKKILRSTVNHFFRLLEMGSIHFKRLLVCTHHNGSEGIHQEKHSNDHEDEKIEKGRSGLTICRKHHVWKIRGGKQNKQTPHSFHKTWEVCRPLFSVDWKQDDSDQGEKKYKEKAQEEKPHGTSQTIQIWLIWCYMILQTMPVQMDRVCVSMWVFGTVPACWTRKRKSSNSSIRHCMNKKEKQEKKKRIQKKEEEEKIISVPA